MKKVRKGKKMLILISIAIILIIVATLIIIKVVHKKGKTPETPVEETQQVIQLPETTYSSMQVKNIRTMSIYNTTSNKVKDENLDAILIGPDGNVLGKIQTFIKKLDVNEQYDISVVLKGDLTSAQQIKLEKK